MQRFVILCAIAALLVGCSKEKRSDKAAEKMQNFVIGISTYAKIKNPNFIIIPQNGIELCYRSTDVNEGINTSYFNAIDGQGVEELFYNGNYIGPDERVDMLQQISESKKVLVSEFLNNENKIDQALTFNYDLGFICFPRKADNYYYNHIPDLVPFENSLDINQLSDAKNYLYYITVDGFATKENFIAAVSATNFDIVLTDLFFDGIALTPSDVNALKTKANGGKRLVICYISIGSAENFRYYWNKTWNSRRPSWIKKKYEGYEDEYWVKFWKKEWQEIIYGNDGSYMKKILDADFDGAYLDNVEAYYFLYFDD